MIKIEIIIFSVEGDKSYTEQHFFEGMNDFVENYHKFIHKINVHPIGPASRKKSNSVEKVKDKLSNALEKMKMDLKIKNNNTIMFFFVGDGDVEEAKDAMEHSKEILINEINDYYPNNKFIKIENKILFAKNGFENLLKISKTKITKKADNYYLFNNIAEKKQWYTNGKIDWDKIYKFFKDTNYEVLFRLFTNQKDDN